MMLADFFVSFCLKLLLFSGICVSKDVMTYFMESNCGKSLDLEYINTIKVEAQPSSKSSSNLQRICTVTLSLAKTSQDTMFSRICVSFDYLKISNECNSALSLVGVASGETKNAMYFLCEDQPPTKEVCSVSNTLVITMTRGSQKASDVQFALRATNKFPESRLGWQEERWKNLEERQESSTIISIVCGAVVGAMFLVVMVTVCIMYQRNQARARSASSHQNGTDNPPVPGGQGTGKLTVAYTAVPRNDNATPQPGGHPMPEFHPMHVLPSHTPSEPGSNYERQGIPPGFQQYAINSDTASQRHYQVPGQPSLAQQGQVPHWKPPGRGQVYGGGLYI